MGKIKKPASPNSSKNKNSKPEHPQEPTLNEVITDKTPLLPPEHGNHSITSNSVTYDSINVNPPPINNFSNPPNNGSSQAQDIDVRCTCVCCLVTVAGIVMASVGSHLKDDSTWWSLTEGVGILCASIPTLIWCCTYICDPNVTYHSNPYVQQKREQENSKNISTKAISDSSASNTSSCSDSISSNPFAFVNKEPLKESLEDGLPQQQLPSPMITKPEQKQKQELQTGGLPDPVSNSKSEPPYTFAP